MENRKGFVSIDEAIALIEKDTRTNPVVDTAEMQRSYNYTRVGGNFRIPLLKRNEDTKKIERAGEVYVTFPDEEALWRFRGELKKHYKEMSGKDLVETRVRSFTTTVDPAKNPGGRIQVNTSPMTKAGQDLGSGSQVVEG